MPSAQTTVAVITVVVAILTVFAPFLLWIKKAPRRPQSLMGTLAVTGAIAEAQLTEIIGPSSFVITLSGEMPRRVSVAQGELVRISVVTITRESA